MFEELDDELGLHGSAGDGEVDDGVFGEEMRGEAGVALFCAEEEVEGLRGLEGGVGELDEAPRAFGLGVVGLEDVQGEFVELVLEEQDELMAVFYGLLD